MKESAENQFKQFEYFVRFPESDGPWFEDPKADAVQHVENEKQVKKLIKKKEPMLLMFYTPWCSACKTVKKEFPFISWDAHANFCNGNLRIFNHQSRKLDIASICRSCKACCWWQCHFGCSWLRTRFWYWFCSKFALQCYSIPNHSLLSKGKTSVPI